MRALFLAVAALLALAPLARAGDADPQAITVVGATVGVHDPSAIIKEGDTYYLFSTTADDDVGEFGIRCSKDMKFWIRCGVVLPGVPNGIPDWIKKESPKTTRLWAPDISYWGGLYHLYYCYSVFGFNTSGIALLTNKTLNPKSPDYKWVDEGLVLKTDVGDDYNAIDPNLATDVDGQPWLVFGSYWSGIKLRKIDATTGKVSMADTKLYSLASRPGEKPPAIEAPFIVYHGGFYYLFVSYDFCCRGTSSTYRTMVGRAKQITGPYLDAHGDNMMDGGATELLKGNTLWHGPGGESVYQGKEGDFLIFHAYGAKNGKSALQISTLTWAGGWPHAALAGTP